MKECENLILIGNGFDIWQGLPTSYSDFGNYYEKNKDRIGKELNIEPITIGHAPQAKTMNYFEALYWFASGLVMGMGVLSNQGNDYGKDFELPQNPIPAEFWYQFEEYLYDLDIDYVLDFFRNNNDYDLELMQLDFADLHKLIREYLYQWINSVEIDLKPTDYDFSNCFFINFNYTDSLRKRFGVENALDYHIHGFANNKQTLCFGHTNKIDALDEYYEYQATDIIKNYLTLIHKKPQEKIKKLNKYLKNHQIDLKNIKTIYVLGHSFGKTDFEYFKFLAKTYPHANWQISYHTDKDKTKIKNVMHKLNVENYKLIKDIPDTIKPFAKQK